MGYEYEGRIIGILGGVEDRHFIDLSDYKEELKEVYRKARAFDEIKERIYYENLAWTDEGYYDGYHERIGSITDDVIDKYDKQMEDKQ